MPCVTHNQARHARVGGGSSKCVISCHLSSITATGQRRPYFPPCCPPQIGFLCCRLSSITATNPPILIICADGQAQASIGLVGVNNAPCLIELLRPLPRASRAQAPPLAKNLKLTTMWSNNGPKKFQEMAPYSQIKPGVLFMPNTFLTTPELCQLLRCSQTTLWRLRRDVPGFPQPGRLRRRLLWTPEQVSQVVALIK